MLVDAPVGLRIAIFSSNLFFGGAEWDSLNLAGGFVDLGYSVDLVLTRRAGELLSEVPQSVRTVDLKANRALTSLLPLVSYLRTNSPDFLITSLTQNNVIGLLAKRFARVPTRVVVRECVPLGVVYTDYSPRLRGRAMPFIARLTYPSADAVVAITGAVADDLSGLLKLPRESIRVLFNPAFRSDLEEKSRQSPNHKWFEPGAPPVILSAGRLTAPKDYVTLIKAFALVRKERSARLMILGEGPDRMELETLVQRLGLQENVSLPGFSKNPLPYMAAASVFVLSTRSEGLGNVLVEAMACGTPVVATDCPGGPREVLGDGQYGTLVPVGDEKLMAKAIERAIEVPPPPAKLKQAAERFSVSRIAQEYAMLFKALRERPPRFHEDNR